jgi:hypothetical protein
MIVIRVSKSTSGCVLVTWPALFSTNLKPENWAATYTR